MVELLAWGERAEKIGRYFPISLFFPPAVLSTTPTHGHFVPSPVSLTLRDPHLHLRSDGKIGDCEQSSNAAEHSVYSDITQ